MAAYGYFGKIPGAGDFLYDGLPARATDIWAGHMADWLETARNATDGDWTGRFLTSPVWRFAIAGGLLGQSPWVGLFAASVDRVGREFPFTVMIAADVDTGSMQPVRLLDRQFDAVEETMLAVIEGGDRAGLTAILGKASAAVRRDIAEEGDAASAGRLILPRPEDDAICIRSIAGGHAEYIAYSWPAPRNSTRDERLCMWWHEGSGGRPADFCVTRGIPAGPTAAPFFLGEWERHGWRQCEHTIGRDV